MIDLNIFCKIFLDKYETPLYSSTDFRINANCKVKSNESLRRFVLKINNSSGL